MKKTTRADSEEVWHPSTDVPGMLRHRINGRFYSHCQFDGKWTYRSLKTRVRVAAKLPHRDIMTKTERQWLEPARVEPGPVFLGALPERHHEDYLGNTSYFQTSKTGERHGIDRLVTDSRKCFGAGLRRVEPVKVR